jgi:phosphate-selective porin OprO/OprP
MRLWCAVLASLVFLLHVADSAQAQQTAYLLSDTVPQQDEPVERSNAVDAPAELTSQPHDAFIPPGVTFRLRGRIDTDGILADQSAANRVTFGEARNVLGLRRARIGGEGSLGSEGHYVAEIDLASGLVVPRDVFVGFGAVQVGERRLGHFREPFSLEGGTSANSFAFLERSPINILDPARNWGLGLFRADTSETTALALGVFHAGTDTSDFQGGDGSTVGLTGRLTVGPGQCK